MFQQHLLPTVFFAVVAYAAYALFLLFDPQRLRVRARVHELLIDDKLELNETQGATTPKFLLGLIELVEKAVPIRLSNREMLKKRLMRAGVYDASAHLWFSAVKLLFTSIPALCVIVASVLMQVHVRNVLLYVFAGGGAGSLVPGLWLDRRIYRRHLDFRRSLPDFLDLMIVCLEGGLSLQDTMRRVAAELQLVHPLLARELSIVQRDIEMGALVDQALTRFGLRTECDGVRTLTAFIRESHRFGTNITDALRNHAEMLRSQREQAAEENAQKAAVKILMPTLLLIFPATFVVLVGPAVIQIQQAFATK